MLDSEAKANEGIEDQDGEELDLISQMADMSLRYPKIFSILKLFTLVEKKLLIRPQGHDVKETTALLKKNPIFEESCESSKIATVISELKKLKEKSNVCNFLLFNYKLQFLISNFSLDNRGHGKSCDYQPMDLHVRYRRGPHQKTWNEMLCNKW
jgi:hypothetical protein